MVQTFDAIVVGGTLHPIGTPQLAENERLRVTVEPATAAEPAIEKTIPPGVDPLAGLACDTGISDLAENFDDYRFGRRQP
ncbi:hypothetical protein [Lacipirellula sp.]|uniref:hypothetical protein n=1 Tax=Lacipirellula sp. TaxID=2691419 RepID=UPI003D0B9B95